MLYPIRHTLYHRLDCNSNLNGGDRSQSRDLSTHLVSAARAYPADSPGRAIAPECLVAEAAPAEKGPTEIKIQCQALIVNRELQSSFQSVVRGGD